MDYDPQGSSTRWLSLRSKERPFIHGVEAHKKPRGNVTRVWQNRVIPDTDRVIIDAPAGVNHDQLIEFVRQVDTIIIPVLPSPIDIHAATRFVEDLLLVAKVRQFGVRVGVVANRAKKNTKIYQSLERFLKTLHLPFISTLRDTQYYVRAAERGIGIHEMWDKRVDEDKSHWQPLIAWLEEDSSTLDSLVSPVA
jgi:chromosome partitioning protein